MMISENLYTFNQLKMLSYRVN